MGGLILVVIAVPAICSRLLCPVVFLRCLCCLHSCPGASVQAHPGALGTELLRDGQTQAVVGRLEGRSSPPARRYEYWLAAAGVGGFVGAEYGSRRLSNMALRRLLAVVLIVAGVKLLAVR